MKHYIVYLTGVVFFSGLLFSQTTNVTVSGRVEDNLSQPIEYVNIILKQKNDSSAVAGGITDSTGKYILPNLKSGVYFLEFSFVGYKTILKPLYIGNLSNYLSIDKVVLEENTAIANTVVVNGTRDHISSQMDRKTFNLGENITQNGGSVLQSMQNLPGVTVQDGKIQLRGNEKVAILIDGKQTGLTGFGSQTNLDNIPASAIEKIEIINNPSAKYDANGNAGIINIIYKKNVAKGFNGKASLFSGLGALGIKQNNLPGIRPQYQYTPKLNPSLSLNYKHDKYNIFFQGDYNVAKTLNKNEFTTRIYDDGAIVNQQIKRNRTTTIATVKSGIDYTLSDRDVVSFSGLFSSERILDKGDQPFFNSNNTNRLRLWQFLEDELKTTLTASSNYTHNFSLVGQVFKANINYTYHRENEKYYFDNIMPTFNGKDAFKLLSDEKVLDLNLDYFQPLKYGSLQFGTKVRRRTIPTNMQFLPGLNSPLDSNAGGWATYKEVIPAIYTNYIYENEHLDLEAGVRLEYINLNYLVNPNHPTYKSNGYSYFQPFPSFRMGYKLGDNSKLSLFYNRRVDRPNEVDIRIFPKYDDAEIIKVGNPALKPQFTNAFELGYKNSWKNGYLYTAIYHKASKNAITRIASQDPSSTLIYAIFQNAGKSYNTGLELTLSQKFGQYITSNLNFNVYKNQVNAFEVNNKYPVVNSFTVAQQSLISGNVKLNTLIKIPKLFDFQIAALYYAPDVVPQGKTNARFSLDLGVKKTIQKGRGAIVLNATDLLNTMVVGKTVYGTGFRYISRDYYETQVVKIGYTYDF